MHLLTTFECVAYALGFCSLGACVGVVLACTLITAGGNG